MKRHLQRTGTAARQAAIKAGRLVRDPLSPYRSVRELYQPTGQPDVFEEMTLHEHLTEVRDRIVRIVIVIIPLFLLSFFLAPSVLEQIQMKANASQGLDIRAPTDPLMLYFKVSLYIAVAMGMPVIVYQLIAFLSPGLTRKEKRVLFAALPFVTLLFIGGVSYGYFVAAPQAMNFLSGFQAAVFNWEPDANETLSFFMTLMLGLGISFQLPLVMFLLSRLGIVSPRTMRAWRRYAILLIAIAAAIITPSTDPFNMMLVAIPLYALYEVGIVVSSVFAGRVRPENVAT